MFNIFCWEEVWGIQEKKVLIWLWGLRVGALVILVFTVYWSFSEVWFGQQFTHAIPLNYLNSELNYQSPKMAVLLMPILVNIALWYHSYVSYIFIRVVIVVELCKTFIVVVMSAITTVTLLLGLAEYGDIIAIFLAYVYFIFLVYLNKVICKPELRNYFYGLCVISNRKKIKAIAIIAAVYCSLFFVLSIEKSYFSEKFSATDNLIQYYVAGQDRSQGHASYMHELRLSPNGKWFSNVHSDEESRGDIGIYNIMTGELIKKLDVKNVYYSMFSFNSESLFLIKKKRENKVIFEEWDTISGKKIRIFEGTESLLNKENGRDFYVKDISSSCKGTYILTSGRDMIIWDYKDGELIDFYTDYADEKKFDWLTDSSYIVVQTNSEIWKKTEGNDEKKSIYVGEIINNEKVIRTKKENMTEDFIKKTDGLYQIKFSIKKGLEDNIAAITITGIPKYGVFAPKTYLDIWDIANEKKIFSLENPNEIISVVFYSNKKHVLILENLYEAKRKISIWDINEHRKEKDYYIIDPGNVVDMKILENEKQLVQLKNPVSIFNMK